MLIRKNGILLPRLHPRFTQIENDLNRLVYNFNGDSTRMIFYEEFGDHILLPRYYPIDEDINDLSNDGKTIRISSNIIPRNDRQKKSINFLINNNHGILRLEPGSGKTVIAIALISKVKKKSIIFAHKDKLIDQWKQEILKFTNLKEDDIGRLTTQNYESVLKKKIILSTPHILAFAVNKKKTKFLDAIRNSGIGIAIFDECHTSVGPEQFSKASLSINCKRIYGLSATPTRADGNDDIIQWHLGEIKYFQPEEGELLIPKIYMIYFSFNIYLRYRKYLTWGGKFQLSRYYKQMFKSNKYIETTSKIIKKAYDQGRTILVLGIKIDCLIDLAKNSNIPPKDVGIFIPGATSKQRLSVSDTDDLDIAFNTKKVVFGTYLGCRDGNNRKDLDCLIMSAPTANVEQAIGRIQRSLDEKKQPLVIDLVDLEGPDVWSINSTKENRKRTKWFLRSAEKRLKIYKKFNWNVEIINLKG